ncbi:uncharacterized protein LOC5516299 isoform X2 [Nematostella vectensis]|uniref:uncharacterized protein LOC5516299 isoform X2 n=1 Tax=Nematostella vectensis TaxID=45351 RepID=UPI0020777237|nr:uncharacterized protein LOC5516299 isoform X2 [Nematostella vectensis]
MSSNQAILPYIDKNACLVQQHGKGMSRRRAIEQRIEKRRSEIRPHCSSASSSKSDFEDDRKLSPLVKYQVQRSICSAMDLSPRYQEAKVDEWLQKNRIKVRHKLPRLDPLTLTSRGVDMEKYINFIYPPPMCLKLRNGIPPRQRRPSYEEVIAEPKEPCPRLLRALHGKEHSLVLNPVVRVGGGYKRLTWKTAEVLPGIGQRPQDVTSAFTCATCGVNMAVSQEIMDGDGVMRVVVTYPSNCASCGKYVNARRRNMLEERALDYGVPAHESVKQTIYRGNPGQVFDHRRFGNKDQDKKRRERRQRKDDEDYETEVDWRNDMDSFREHMSRADSVSDDNENDPDSVERNGDGFFITEPGIEVIGLEKPSSAPEVRSAWDDGSNSAHVTRGYDSDTRPSHDEVIVEHRDPESGIRIRVRKKERGGKEYDTRDKRSHRGRKWRDERGNTSRDQRDEGLSDDGKLRDDDDSKWRDYQSQGSQGGDGQGLRDEEDIQYEGGREGRDKHYSKLHARRKRHAKRHRRHDINGSATAIEGVSSDESSSYEFIIYQSSGDIRHRTRSSDIRRENARVVKSDGEIHDMERWYRAMKARHNTKRRRTFPKSHTMYPPSAGSDSDYLDEVQLQRKLTATFAAQSSRDGQTLLKADDMAERPHDPGYIADSEEDQLKMLQAQLRRMHRQSRKRSGSGRHRQHNDLPRSQTREERQHTDLPRSQTRKERRKGTGKSTKVDVSLEERGSSSDSWDSEESLHVRPLSEQFYDSASDTSPLPRKLRSATLDDRQLPSRRATHHGRRTSQRSMDGSAHAQGDEDEAKNDGNGETSEKPGNTKNKYKRREYSKKTVTNQVSIKPTNLRRNQKFEDDLSDSDIQALTAQMQSYNPSNGSQPEGNHDDKDLYCKGQNCYRCGTFIDECEGTCTACGTHCKKTTGPCTACRDVCDRCGKARWRCESQPESLGTSDEEEDGAELVAEGKGIDIEGADDEMESNGDEEQQSDEEGHKNHNPQTSKTLAKKPKTKRKPVVKKKRNTDGVKIPLRTRASTLDSVGTGMEQEDFEELSDQEKLKEEANGNEESEEVTGEKTAEDAEETRPKQSQYNKVKKRAKASKQVVSQTVIVKGGPNKKALKEKEKSTEEKEDGEKDPAVKEPGDYKEDAGKEDDVIEKKTQEDHHEGKKLEEKDGETKKEIERTENAEEKQKVEEKPKLEEPPAKPATPKLKGIQRVNAAFKNRTDLNRRLQSVLKVALNNEIADADMKVRRDSTIDYLAQYRLVDRSKIEVYGRAFTVEDEDEEGILTYEQMLMALEGVPTITGMSRQQLNYVLQVLEINSVSRISFKMFAVITALCERVITLDPMVKDLVEGLDLSQTEWKLDLYKNMFYVTGDRSATFISSENLRIELKAGGLSQIQEDHVIRHIMQTSDDDKKISFLDYMAYLPLFLSIHENICANALDMSRDKYTKKKR